MMMIKDCIGSSPCGEHCAHLGSENYEKRAKKECKAFREQIIRVYGTGSLGCCLFISNNPHDFGTYYSVDIRYDDEDDVGINYFLDIEGDKNNGLEYWDEIAKQELGIK